MTNIDSRIHTVFGAGQVGQRLAEVLLAAGHTVRLVRRGPAGEGRDGLTWLSGDITDAAFARSAAAGAEVIYNCTNPTAYHRWDALLPPLYAAVTDAAATSGARLVTLDNVYMYGDTDGAPMTEATPMDATTRKGALRARLHVELRARADRGDFHLTTGRASDFFGPGAALGAIFSNRSHDRLAADKAVEVLGDPDLVHSYSFIPDVARGLATLGTRPTPSGGVFHLPVAWQGSTRALLDRIAVALGHPRAKVRTIPSWFLRAGGTLVPLLAAVAEMTYQWERDFVLDDQRFTDTFGASPTVEAQAIAETAAWIEATVGRSAVNAGPRRPIAVGP